MKASRGDFEAVDGLEGGLDIPGVDGRDAIKLAGTAETLDDAVSVGLTDRSLRSERRFRLGVAGRSEAAALRALEERC